MFSLVCAWTNVWVYNRYAADLRRHRDHYDVTVMSGTRKVSYHWSMDLRWCIVSKFEEAVLRHGIADYLVLSLLPSIWLQSWALFYHDDLTLPQKFSQWQCGFHMKGVEPLANGLATTSGASSNAGPADHYCYTISLNKNTWILTVSLLNSA